MAVGRHVGDEQRVAAGVGDDRVGVVGRDAHERGDLVAVEAAQLEACDGGRALQIGEQRGQVGVEVGRGVPRRGHDEQARPTGRADELAEDVAGRGRRPVQVLDHEQGRRRRRGRRQPVPDPVDHRRGCGQVVRTRCGRTARRRGAHDATSSGHADRRRRRPHRRWPGRTARTVAPRPRSRHRTAPAHRRRAPRPPARRRGGSCPSPPRRPRPPTGCARPPRACHRSRSRSRSATRPTKPAGSASSSSAGGSSAAGTGVCGRRPSAGAPDEVAPVGRVELAQQRRHVRLHGALRDEQRGRDLGVRPALHDQVEDLGLPPRDTPVRCGSSPPDRVEVRRRQEERRLRAEATQLHRPDVDQVPSRRQRARHDGRRRLRSPPPRHRGRPRADGRPDSPPDRSSRRRARPPRPCARPHECGSPPRPATPRSRTATCSRCAARSASVARVNTENVESPSPRAFNTVPPSPSTAAVTSSSWRASATAIASGARSHSSVEPTTSVSTNETTPVGNAPTDPA